MNVTRRWIASLLILFLTTLILMGCDSPPTTLSELSPTQGYGASAPGIIASPNPSEAFAQATIDYGQSQLLDLAHKSTQVSLNKSQAANAAAQSTEDDNQRQKMDLNYQATIVSLTIAQAAATQKFIKQQKEAARDATAIVESYAAEATRSAYLMNVTQTAQVQAFLEAQAIKTDQAVIALTAYPLTATYSAHSANGTQSAQAVAALTAYPQTVTPFAATKAALLMQEYDREQQSFTDKVVAPLIPFLAILLLILFILAIILAYRWLMPMSGPGRLLIGRGKIPSTPLIIIEGVSADLAPQLPPIIPLELTPANAPQMRVEIMSAMEPPVSHWIAEVEQQLSAQGGLSV